MRYFGGKNLHGVYQRLINHIPPHRVYIEPYLGSGALMRLKRRAEINIGLDIDAEVLSSFPWADIELRCCDALKFLGEYQFAGDEFVYLDPPYLRETRRSHNRYRYETDRAHHERLLGLAQEIPCNVMISGYNSELYQNQLAGWRSFSYAVRNRSGETVQEHLWMNYPEPYELHDYSYIGGDFRERQRIKRKHERLKEKIFALPRYEKLHLINELTKRVHNGQKQERSE